MTTWIDVTPAVHQHGGIGRYAEELVTALMALGQDELATIGPLSGFFNGRDSAEIPPALASLPMHSIQLAHKPWRAQVMLAHFLHRSQAARFASVDLFHGTDHLLPYLPQTPTVLTVHDLVYRVMPETQTRFNHLFLRWMMPRFYAQAQRIITVSQNTANDIRHYYPAYADKITTIHPGVNERFKPITSQQKLEQVRAKYQLPPRFALFVGTVEPRKNLVNILRGFDQAGIDDLHLILGGRIGWRSSQFMADLRERESAARIQSIGYIDDEDLPALYTLAELFLFPSRYEGFGLPILEAMACGTAVITANVASLPEVAGSAARLVDPDSPSEIAASLAELAASPAQRETLIEAGFQRVKQFRWEDSARATLALYRAAQAA